MWFRLALALTLIVLCTAIGDAHAPPRLNTAQHPPLVYAAGDQVGPSFDCATVAAPLPRLICSNPRLAYVDLLLVQAYQVLRAQVDESTKAEIRSEALELHQVVHADCNIPLTGLLTREVESLADCVDAHYMRQRNEWLSRLSSDAREEATRPIRRHIELQRLLQQLSFLSSIATVDGNYGPETRKAISEWQRSRGLNDTGILSDQHASVLEQAISQKAAEEQGKIALAQELEKKRLEQEQWEHSQAEAEKRAQKAKAEAQQHDQELFQAKWDACKAYQVSACDGALQAANLAAWQRTNLIEWRSAAQQFAGDVQACRNGSIAACEVAMQSPAASDSQKLYLSQWRDAASPLSRSWKYISETASAIVNMITGAPLSTLIAGSIALVLAAALIVLLLVMYRQPRRVAVQAREPEPELEPEPAPGVPPPPPPHNYSSGPTPGAARTQKREERSSRSGAAGGSGGGGLYPPHEAPARTGRQPKYVSGGAKAAGVAINVFFPGIGSFFVRKPIEGVCHLALNVCTIVMAYSIILAPVAVFVHLGNWIWAIASAANTPTRPLQVVIQNGPVPGQL